MISTKLYFIAVLLLLISCQRNGENNVAPDIQVVNRKNIVIPDFQVAKEQLILHPNEGKWYYDHKPFSGQSVVYYPNGVLAESVGYYQGKKEGIAQKWFADGLLRRQSHYIVNHLDGILQIWSPNPNSILISESQYIDGVQHGVQTKWHTNGQLSRRTNINMGNVVGMQQAWLRNGKIYVNYEAKNGRIFGLKKSILCYELEDENIQF